VLFELKIVPAAVLLGGGGGRAAAADERAVAVRVVDQGSRRARLWSRDKFLDRMSRPAPPSEPATGAPAPPRPRAPAPRGGALTPWAPPA